MSNATPVIKNDLFYTSMKIREVAIDLFNAHIPPEALKRMDFSTLEWQDKTFIEPKYRDFESDILYSVKMDNDKLAYIYTFVENKNTPSKDMVVRLYRYGLEVLSDHIKENPNSELPLLHKIMIYTGKDEWNIPLGFFDLYTEENKELIQKHFLNYKVVQN